ncbi:MAG: hypothetical protein AAGI03_09095 [Pseudomonadota bacterium]
MGFVSLRSTAKDAPSFLRWVGGADYGDFCIYHIHAPDSSNGSVAVAKRRSRVVWDLTEMVAAFAAADVVHMAQYRMQLAQGPVIHYTATRSQQRKMPEVLLTGELNGTEYLALRAVRDNDTHEGSIARIVSLYAGYSRARSKKICTALNRKGFLESAGARRLKMSKLGYDAVR